MLHYYFFKYWGRGIVGLMIAILVGYFGIFSYSLLGEIQPQVLSEAAQLSTTPAISSLQVANPGFENSYKKSIHVFEEIRKLKEKKQDTAKLETMYADSVKNLSNQNQPEAEKQLQQIEEQIVKINSTLETTPTPVPSGILVSVTPSAALSPAPSGSQNEATNSAEIE